MAIQSPTTTRRVRTGRDYQIGPGGPNPLDAAAYTLNSFSAGTESDLDKEIATVVNLDLPAHLFGGTEDVKVGLSARLRDKTLAPITINYLAVPGVSLSPYVDGNFISYYDHHYQNGYDFNVPALEALYASGTGFVVDSAGNLAADQQSWQQNQEDVYAAYAQYHYSQGPLGILFGARLEQTRAKYSAFAFNADTNTLLGENTQDNSYTNVFPTFQVRYEFDPSLVGRASISSAIARPGFQQITAAVSVSVSSESISQGNPALKPTTGYNLDFALDKTLDGGGVLSLGVFDKELKNYITQTGYRTEASTLPQDPVYAGLTGVVSVTSYANISKARATGTEFGWEQQFKSLPGAWGGLGAGANWTWVSSSGDIRPGVSSILPSTARNTWNADVFYDYRGLQLKLAAYYTSRVLFSPNLGDATGYTDVYQSERLLADFGASYALNAHAGVYLNVKNITNDAMRFSEGPDSRPIQREFYGITYQGGVAFQF